MSGAGQDAAPRGGLRRRALILGGVVAVGAAAVNAPRAIRALFPPAFEFEALETPAGFRRLAGGGGGVSAAGGAGGALLGLAPPGPQPERTARETLLGDLCGRLFGAAAAREGRVPVASFSDYFCPWCRVLARHLSALEAEGGIAVNWLEWPLFGETSETAARAALAAKRQGAYAEFHGALGTGGFVPTEGYLADLAGRLGLDAARLRADMGSAGVAREIADARGLAGLFGFIGTPALVVGRTAVSGALDAGALAALVRAERAAGAPPGCA